MKHHPLPVQLYNLLQHRSNFVLLETSKFDENNFRTFLFIDPEEILIVNKLDDLPNIFREIENFVSKGKFAAGYFTYECGYHFEHFPFQPPEISPAVWFGIYNRPIIFNHITGKFEGFIPDITIENENKHTDKKTYQISDIYFSISESQKESTIEEYQNKIQKIKQHIASGDTYQINLTGKIHFQFHGCPITFYRKLKEFQPVSYAAVIKNTDETIISLSPELFFRKCGNVITSKPMKGTIRRGKTLREDHYLKNYLHTDEKSQAENLMIVDLIRNDLGKISKTGSVKVVELFNVEKYKTLFQMTSTIQSILKDDIKYYDIFKALFPSGSVTGAPKISSMNIIHKLEKTPRRIYTGAIGYFSPHEEAVFNVAIRTLSLRNNSGEMGVGGGIVWDSVPISEYQECLLKASFLTSTEQDFEIIETILWDREYRLLDKHFDRLSRSSEYFDYPLDILILKEKLTSTAENFIAGRKYRVRVLLSISGEIKIEWTDWDESFSSSKIFISPERTNSNDIFLYHKTTNRKLYNRMSETAKKYGCIDVIFMNERDEITEGAISNIFIEKRGMFYTPPISCGLLGGVYRQFILDTLPNVKEKILYLTDIKNAEAIYICNVIRGMQKVNLVENLYFEL